MQEVYKFNFIEMSFSEAFSMKNTTLLGCSFSFQYKLPILILNWNSRNIPKDFVFGL